MVLLTSSFKLLTSRTVANANPGVVSPLMPGAVWPNAKLPRPGIAPATPPAYGVVSGDAKLCMNGLLRTPGAPESRESAQLQIPIRKCDVWIEKKEESAIEYFRKKLLKAENL